MLAGPPRLVSAVTIILLFGLGWWYFSLIQQKQSSLSIDTRPPPKTPSSTAAPSTFNPLDFTIPLQYTAGKPKPPGSNYSRILVFPKTKDEDIRWMSRDIPDIPKAMYEVDNPNAEYHVPKNKGREAMVYLTYLIDHYDDLPDIILFFHAHQHAWHNNILLGLDNGAAINRINNDRVVRMGFMNTRCHHEPGCPDWIHLDRPATDFDFFKKPEEIYYRKHVWEEIHPGAPIPSTLSGVCCAQFALSRERARQVPRERYIHYRQWLLDSQLDDQFSGRIFEYIWHYIFTGQNVFCPSMNSCYCDGYGVCFGGRQAFQDFMDKMDERNKRFEEMDAIQKKKTEAEDEGKTYEYTKEEVKKMKELEDLVRKYDAEMEVTRNEAFKRGEDKNARELETETYDDTHIWDKWNEEHS